ncbi:MAG: hydroxyethylthiazole kinase [Rikenellaceae bacterium]|jgi:hydroxyethylthiazole kinase|nr:hydroxyethylthiazole kinase [Rikenellaceae bacterium]
MKKEDLWGAIAQMREKAPLVLSITNFVVMNNTANALLAAGASPIMAHASDEIEDMVALCGATVINIGTLDAAFVNSMKMALRKADELGKPTVLDPVGAGATAYRNRVIDELFGIATPSFVRGNAGEIMTVAGLSVTSKGVDSTASSDESVEAGIRLAREKQTVVSISGPTDYITDGVKLARVENGSHLMPLVTGLGCTASALLGAMAAAVPDRLLAATAAAALLAVSGEIAATLAAGPGTLQLHLYDVLHTLTEQQFMDMVRFEVGKA